MRYIKTMCPYCGHITKRLSTEPSLTGNLKYITCKKCLESFGAVPEDQPRKRAQRII